MAEGFERRFRCNANVLDKASQLIGLMFDCRPEHGGTRDIGLVAENVGCVVPELATREPDGQFATGLKYERLTAWLVEAVKTLKEEQRSFRLALEAARMAEAKIKGLNQKLEQQAAETVELKQAVRELRDLLRAPISRNPN